MAGPRVGVRRTVRPARAARSGSCLRRAPPACGRGRCAGCRAASRTPCAPRRRRTPRRRGDPRRPRPSRSPARCATGSGRAGSAARSASSAGSPRSSRPATRRRRPAATRATEYSWTTRVPSSVSRSYTAASTLSRSVTLRNRYAANTPGTRSPSPHDSRAKASSSARPSSNLTPGGQFLARACSSMPAEASIPTTSARTPRARVASTSARVDAPEPQPRSASRMAARRRQDRLRQPLDQGLGRRPQMGVVARVEADHQVVSVGGLVEGLGDVRSRDRGHSSCPPSSMPASRVPEQDSEDGAVGPELILNRSAPRREFLTGMGIRA